MKVTLQDIQKAHEILKKIISPTETVQSISASQIMKTEIYLKLENTQRTGSFKLRGAYNKIANLSQEEKARGVVASSAGNHAQGVALSASLAQVKSLIVMPENASLNKIESTRNYGAEVVLHGEVYDDAFEHAKKLEKEKGYTFVHPYEDAHVIAGQGTIALEILQKVPDLDSLVVPIGGGGLISGIAVAAKSINPKIRVIGVQSAQAPGMSLLFNKTTGKKSSKIITIADGIAIKNPSKVMFENFISKYVDQVVTVSDDEIAETIVFLLEKSKTVAEGAGAAGLAAVFNRSLDLGAKSCVVLCGGNIDLNIVSQIIERGQIRRGRLAAISVVIDDMPGSLHKLTAVLSALRANIIEVHHDRVSQNLFLRETRVDFVFETSGPEHVQRIKEALITSGAKII
ncbi:MAG: threonine ammonia-lyase [Pseudobdellovibrionaceae bacterium]